ncbi:MAG: peroxide stress protein YaaA [Lachnospiraceae bacterium]|nr:peroxide stress protein YaaA [Lachnospiraceae bacterium]
MKIIISPAKKMKVDTDIYPMTDLPVFLQETALLMEQLQEMSYGALKELWNCNDRIAKLNHRRLKEMDLKRNLTPAILSYEGIQYQYMAPVVFTERALGYIQDHLRILSGFYGVLRPMDGVTPYRLEMQAKFGAAGVRNLYEFWDDKLYKEVTGDDRIIVNLASREYSKCVEKYLQPGDVFVTCEFGEIQKGKVIQKGTLAKMARGEMVRYMAEHAIGNLDGIKGFHGLGYRFREELSSKETYVFVKEDI